MAMWKKADDMGKEAKNKGEKTTKDGIGKLKKKMPGSDKK